MFIVTKWLFSFILNNSLNDPALIPLLCKLLVRQCLAQGHFSMERAGNQIANSAISRDPFLPPEPQSLR